MSKTFDRIPTLGILIVLAISIGLYSYNQYKENHKVTCSTSTIAFNVVKQETESLNVGETKTIQQGKAGELITCSNNAGYKSEKVVSSATPQIDQVGTKLSGPYLGDPEPVYENYGSICNDGWYSPSVGRGACSWHGGVAY